MIKTGAMLRRYQDIGIYYDSDFGFRSILRQRVYKTEDGTIQTPITDLLRATIVSTDCKIPRAKSFEPRYINACFLESSNITGESILKAIVPYRPTDEVFHKEHIREIAAYPGVQSVDYVGETHTSSVARYLR
jgi:hypothetical protein